MTLYLSNLIPPKNAANTPTAVQEAAAAYEEANEKRTAAERDLAKAKDELKHAPARQLEADVARAEKGEDPSSQTFQSRIHSRVQRAEREVRVAEKLEQQRKDELVTAISDTHEEWEGSQRRVVEEVADDFHTALQRVNDLAHSLAVQAGILHGLVRYEPGRINPERTRFTPRRLEVKGTRTVPAELNLLIDALQRLANEVVAVQSEAELANVEHRRSRAQQVTERLNQETEQHRASSGLRH